MTIRDVDRPHLPEVIADLYNARQVLHHAGWVTEDWLDLDGKVCLDGALEIAAGAVRVDTVYDTNQQQVFARVFRSGRLAEEPTPRHARAQNAVADLVPDFMSCAMCTAARLRSDPVAIVTHFNDVHCHGGDEADDILREAAEKLSTELP